jgi:tape measure domain-containing protein
VEGGDISMSSSIDERIVSMKFNNGQFLNGIAATINALANLKKGLNVDASKKGLDSLGSSMSKLPPPQLTSGVEGISGKFIALSTIGITALANITTAALSAGAQILKSLTIEPIKLGLEEYETNLNSVQTILANTGLEGDKGLGKVTKALDELNKYSDQTIYNFSEMARNIGTFTAAGVSLDTSTQAIKGIANLAAVSGSNAQQASTAMYQLSQSLSTGKVSLEDWNSVVNAGLGGKLFQESLKETARVHGVAVDSIIKEQGSFRNSLQEGWVTSEILTETLSKFTGDLTESQLKTMGYNDEQIKGILKMGKTATDAATKVKTMSQLISTLQETAQSGWAKTWQTIFGDFNEAKSLFTDVNNVLGGMIGASADARNKVLADWDKLGGRTALIEGIKNAFNGVLDILKPVQDAFRDIFPAVTGKQLAELSKGFRDFAATIKIGATDAENLRRTFRGVFAVFSIAGSLIKGLVTTVGSFFGAFSGGTSSLLDFTGGIGDFLVRLDEAIKKSEGFADFFEKLGSILAVPIQLLFALGAAIRGAFEGLDEGGARALDGVLERIGVRLEPFKALVDGVAAAWSRMGDVIAGIWQIMTPFADAVANAFGSLGEAISQSVSDGDFTTILDTINTGLFAALVIGIRKFLSGGKLIDVGGGGFLDSIKEAFGGLTDTLSAMQANLKSGTLIKIAGAVALLTASVVGLSLIDSAALTKALIALTVMFVQLGGAMAAFEAVSSMGSVLKLAPMAAGLILLSTAILILSGAVKVLSTMSWEELGKGLAGVTALLLVLAGAAKLMSAGAKGLTVASVGMIAMAIAVRLLANSVQIFATMSWADLGKGLAGVAGALLLIAGAMQLMPATLPITAIGLLGVAAALVVLTGALAIMAGFTWEEIAKSLVTLAGALIIIAGALYLMTAALPGAAAMLVVAPALVLMASALAVMASLSWEEIGKSLVLLTGSLIILAGAMYLMTAALPGAAALIVVAAALAILTPALVAMGNMSWEEIGRGLVMLAGALAVIGIAGIALTPVIPTLIGLGVAVALLGVGMLAAGAGLLAFSVGLTALSVAGAAGTAALVAIVSGLIGLIPMAMNAVAEGIVLMANVISKAGPQFIRAMTTLMTSLLVSINNVAPKIIDTIWKLVIALANRVAAGYPQLVSAGLRLITGVLNGIASNIGGIAAAATSIVVNFINALAANLPRITNAGADMVITLVNSLASTISSRTGEMRAAGQALAFAIVDGMTGGLLSGGSSVISAAIQMASSALEAAKDVLGIHSPSKEFQEVGKFARLGFFQGLSSGSRSEITRATLAMREALAGLLTSTKEDVKASEARLKELRKSRKQELKDAEGNAKQRLAIAKRYNKAIEREEDRLDRARSTQRKAQMAYRNFRDRLDDEAAALHRLAGRYTSVSKQLDKANQKLADARRTRDDYNKSIRDQYSGMQDITEDTTVKDYLTDLREQVEDTNRFAIALQELRRRGLSDKVYKELLSKGAEALPFAQQLIAGGSASIKEINSLGSQLDTAAGKLGSTASRELYQAGVDAAAGLVRGLAKQKKAIDKAMDRIALSMVNAIKRRLGIKSPSKEFAKVGNWSVDGLVNALKASSGRVQKASEGVGDTAMTALQKSMREVGTAVNADMDLTPTIRPVLDLSAVKRDSSQISGMMTPSGLTVDSSYARASSIAVEERAIRATIVSETPPVTEPVSLKFEQNNYSPKALSNAEIYRQTKNGLSQIKKGLPVSKGVSTT